MANGKISLEEFKKLDQPTRDYHIWSKLDIIDNLSKRFASKWTEKVIIWVGITMGGAFLLALANIVLAVKK